MISNGNEYQALGRAAMRAALLASTLMFTHFQALAAPQTPLETRRFEEARRIVPRPRLVRSSNWDGWVDRCTTEISSLAEANYYDRNDRRIDDLIRETSSTLQSEGLLQSAAFREKYPRFVDFVRTAALPLQPGHSLGFTVPDRTYFKETGQYTEIPPFLRDAGFVRAATQRASLPDAKRYLEQLNASRPADQQLIFFEYVSQHLGTPTNPDKFGRFLVVVPGEVDQWVQFAVAEPGMRDFVGNVSVVAARRLEGREHAPYFNDNFIHFEENGAVRIRSRFEEQNKLERCYLCHKMGVASILPLPGSVPLAELERVRTVNQKIRSYGNANYGKYLDLAKLGPGLGEGLKPKVIEALGGRAGGYRENELDQAMKCGRCHNGVAMGKLSFPLNRKIIGSFIGSGAMPPGTRLATRELEVLHEVLAKDYFSIGRGKTGVLKNWLDDLPGRKP